MRNPERLCLALLVLIIAVCGVAAAQDVRTNYMPGTDFSKYHTYMWIPLQSNIHPNQIVDAEIKQAINGQLQSKGLTLSSSGTADLYVGYQVAVDQERQWNAWGSGGFRLGGGMGSATSSTISNGTLVLDMYDPTTKQLVWQGDATKTLGSTGNQEKDMKNMNKAMQKLLKNFPPH